VTRVPRQVFLPFPARSNNPGRARARARVDKSRERRETRRAIKQTAFASAAEVEIRARKRSQYAPSVALYDRFANKKRTDREKISGPRAVAAREDLSDTFPFAASIDSVDRPQFFLQALAISRP